MDDELYYPGQVIFLYAKFMDELNSDINKINIKNPQVRILHQKNNEYIEDLSWSDMNKIINNEYYYNFIIPDDADNG
jgi:hypothetical protein